LTERVTDFFLSPPFLPAILVASPASLTTPVTAAAAGSKWSARCCDLVGGSAAEFIGTAEVSARGVDPRDATRLPLDPGGADGGDWFWGSDSWDGLMANQSAAILCSGCALLLFLFALALKMVFWAWETEFQN
jgi:hypothetical protein